MIELLFGPLCLFEITPSEFTFAECYKFNPSTLITDFKDKTTAIETIIQENLTSLSTSDFSTCMNMHQTTNDVFVKQIPSDIYKRRTSKTCFLWHSQFV